MILARDDPSLDKLATNNVVSGKGDYIKEVGHMAGNGIQQPETGFRLSEVALFDVAAHDVGRSSTGPRHDRVHFVWREVLDFIAQDDSVLPRVPAQER
jgi:hypothetical protein